MKRCRGFSVVELTIIVVVIGVLAVIALPFFLDLRQESLQSAEDGVVGAVRSGIYNYLSESELLERLPRYPATLDDADNGAASEINPFYSFVLTNAIEGEWSKAGLTYTGPADGIYNYIPTTGQFIKSTMPGGFTGYWPFEEGDGTTTQLGDYEGSFNGDVHWTDGVVGNPLDFDGVDSFVSVPDADIFHPTDEGTLQAWINMDSIPDFAGIIHKGDNTDWSDEAYTLQFWTGNRLLLGVRNESGDIAMLQSNTVFQPGQLYHVAATWDSGGMKIYVNGQLDSSNTVAATAMNSDGNLNIGSQLPTYYNGGWRNLPFDGMIDEVGVYGESISGTDIQEYYDSIINP